MSNSIPHSERTLHLRVTMAQMNATEIKFNHALSSIFKYVCVFPYPLQLHLFTLCQRRNLLINYSFTNICI